MFEWRIPDRQVLSGKRDIVWGDDRAKVPGTYSMRYMMVDRDGNRKHGIGWYEQNHPDELVYQCDRRTVANEYRYSYGYDAPVDIDNADVRERLWSQAVGDIAATSRRYDAIAVDNVSPRNDWKRCGVRGAEGWHQLYKGTQLDPAYIKDVANWIGWLRNRAHQAGMCLAVNLYFHGDDDAGYRTIADQSDIVNDEHGFTRNCGPMDYGKEWIQRTTLYADIAQSKPFEIIDSACAYLSQIDKRILNWSIANYLLIKGNRTYIAIIPDKEAHATLVDFPELYISTGKPLAVFERRGDVFIRRFEHALALVNPFKRHASYDVGKAKWSDFSGELVAGQIDLAPGTGLVLLQHAQ